MSVPYVAYIGDFLSVHGIAYIYTLFLSLILVIDARHCVRNIAYIDASLSLIFYIDASFSVPDIGYTDTSLCVGDMPV